MPQERDFLNLEDILTKKTNLPSEWEKSLSLAELRDYAFLFVDEVCEYYQEDALAIPMKNRNQGVEVLDVYLSRANGIYEVGLNHPFFREFIQFGRKEDSSEAPFLDIIPKYKCGTPRKLFYYEDYPGITYDGFVRILSVVHDVAQRSIEEREQAGEE